MTETTETGSAVFGTDPFFHQNEPATEDALQEARRLQDLRRVRNDNKRYEVSIEEALELSKYEVEESMLNMFCQVLGLKGAAQESEYRLRLSRVNKNIRVEFCRSRGKISDLLLYIDCSYGVLRIPGTKKFRRFDDPDRDKDFSCPTITDTHRMTVEQISSLFRQLLL